MKLLKIILLNIGNYGIIEYFKMFIYAINTYFDNKPKREPYTLEEEITLNKKAKCRIIGICIETRPDAILENDEDGIPWIKTLLSWGVTRLQLGVQQIDNYILKKINRGHTIEQSMEAIKMLLNNCFKVDIHLMPMLPSSTPDMDRKMFDEVLTNPNLQVDQWKVYPTSVVPWSVLEIWYKSGKYKPYSNEELFNVLIEMKRKVYNRIRLIRIVRDINDHYIIGGCSVTHMRQLLLKKLEKEQEFCSTIDPNYKMRVDKFDASGGVEYFISFVSENEKVLYGFCRLRINNDKDTEVLDEIKNHALIRELHVYSFMTPVEDKSSNNIQHRGFGKNLLKKAEELSIQHGYRNIAVISGVGVRNYYRKFGYELDDTYMKKQFNFIKFMIMFIWYKIISILQKKS